MKHKIIFVGLASGLTLGNLVILIVVLKILVF